MSLIKEVKQMGVINNLFKKITELINVKSIITIILTIVFGILSERGDITSEQFLTIFTVVISFYFGTQLQKQNNGSSETK